MSPTDTPVGQSLHLNGVRVSVQLARIQRFSYNIADSLNEKINIWNDFISIYRIAAFEGMIVAANMMVTSTEKWCKWAWRRGRRWKAASRMPMLKSKFLVLTPSVANLPNIFATNFIRSHLKL